MLKYAKVVNDETKACDVGIGDDVVSYQKMGMTLQEVEQGYDGVWYLSGHTPEKPLKQLAEEKRAERDAMLESYIWRVQRYDQQNSLQISTTDSDRKSVV